MKNNKRYWIKNFDIKGLVKKFGSPLIIYNQEIIKENFKAYRKAFPEALIAYAIKANPINAILKILKEEGSGAETASYSEILLALKCGFPKEKIVFNGNAKSKEEIKLALSYNIKINFDSHEEIKRLKLINQGRVPINSGIRINPFIEAGLMDITKTALRTSKFGISIEEVEKVIQEEKIKINTLHFHLGSQISALSPFKKAIKKILSLWDRLLLKGQPLKFLDIGGGLGIDYKKDENIPQIKEYSKVINSLLKGRNIRLILEPGRSLIGNAGVI
ncbi:MAG: diaminopimelate decarboxylase, partial [Armatimonadetes bacterium]|nr:diaminopimelate decarboxylase [Armatimonadota bacterium]